MRILKTSFFTLVITAFVFSSCSRRVFDFTIVSTKNIDLSEAHNFQQSIERSDGTSSVYWVIVIPLGIPDMKDAIDKAIESTPGTVALVDGVVYKKSWWTFIYGYSGYVVEGTPLIDPGFSSDTNEGPVYGKIELDKHGEIQNIESLTYADYLELKGKIVKESRVKRFSNSVEVK